MQPYGERSVLKAIALCIVICGTLDIADALIFFKVHNHVPPVRLLQNIASGLLGKSAFQGGTPTALLGLAMHYTIATFWVVLFVLLAQRIPAMFRHPCIAGAVYGLVVYGVMNYIAVPLSRIGSRPTPTGIVLINAVGALVLFIGLAIGLINDHYAPIPH